MSKGGSRTQSVVQNNEPPAYVQDAQRLLADTAHRITGPYLVNTPSPLNAGFTPDQLQAFNLSRQLADNSFAAPLPGMMNLNRGAAPTYANTAGVMLLPSAATIDPAVGQVTGDKIHALLNPYRDDVLDPTIARMREELGRTQAQIGARNASSAAFGGSREALQLSEANRAFGDQVARITGDLMMQGYDRATATALANAQAMQNAGQFNAGAQNQVGMFNVGQQNQGNQFNATAQNQANQADATRALTAAGLESTIVGDQRQRQLQALAALLGTGNQQQQLAQRYAQEPIDMFKLLMQATPGTTGSTSTQTSTIPTESSPLATLGGLVSIGSGLFGPFGMFPGVLSDERDKTDVKKLGDDPETGLGLYAYRYKGDPKNTPKVVGPMAQEVERRYPGTVHEVGGHKVIDGAALLAALGRGA